MAYQTSRMNRMPLQHQQQQQQQQPRFYSPQGNRRPGPPRPPPPQSQPYNYQGRQQDWQQDGYADYSDQGGYGNYGEHNQYEGYGRQNGYESQGAQGGYEHYEDNAYQARQPYVPEYGEGWEGQYDQGYDNYTQQPISPSHSQRRPRQGPPPPPQQNGMNSSGPRPYPRGPPRGQFNQRPYPPDAHQRQRSQSQPRQYREAASPNGSVSWDNPFPSFPRKPGPGGPPPNERRNRDAPPDSRDQYPPQPQQPPHERSYSQDPPYGYEQGYDMAPDRRPMDPQQRRPMTQGQDGTRNRGPMPQFQSVRRPPSDQRPGTATGIRGPQGRPPMPQYSQTQPNSPADRSFAAQANGNHPPETWHQQPPGPPERSFTLPERPGTAPGPGNAMYRSVQDEEMPAFAEASQPVNPAANVPKIGTSRTPPRHQPNPSGERFEMPGDMPEPVPATLQIGNTQALPQHLALTRAQTVDSYAPQSQDSRPLQPRRQMTDGGRHVPEGQGQYPMPNGSGNIYNPNSGPPLSMPQSPVDSYVPQYGDAPMSRPSTSGGPQYNRMNGERPTYSRGPSSNSSNRPFSPRQDSVNPEYAQNGPRGMPPQQRTMQPQRPQEPQDPQQSQQPQQPQHAKKNSDALPHHPTPVRPGQILENQAGQKPAPVRQYSSRQDSKSSSKPAKPQPQPVTAAELDNLRRECAQKPSDYPLQLTLVKKLAEASRVLADDGGRADPKLRAANQERYNKEARTIGKKLVSAGYPDAMFYMADCYGEGALGFNSDPREAFQLYQSAAKLGHPPSAYRTAVCCEIGAEEGGGTRRDYGKAVAWYKRASNLGDVAATYKMGVILLKGLLGQEKNLREAMVFLRKAADQSDEENPHALHELAAIFEVPGTPQTNEAESLRLYKQAAKLGYKFSQFRLGQAHEYGQLGAPVDARQSIIWYTKAAAQGEHQSELALSGWYLTGAEGILEHSDTEAYLWARKAANVEPPLPKAMFAMGYFTEVGIGCPKSLEEAKRWYGRAAAHGFPKARERLEELKRGGSGAQKKRENLSRSNQKKNDENCTIM